MHIVFDMYRENILNTLVCQTRGNTTMGHKCFYKQTEYEKLLSGGKTKDNLVAYYTDFIIETDKNQLNRKIQSSSVVD